MSDRPSVFQLINVGRETASGTPVAPTFRLGALSIEATPAPTVQPFRPSGYLVHTVAATNYQQTDWQAEGIGTYNEITIPLRMLFGAPTTTNPSAGVYEHVYQLNSSASTPQQTYTAVAGDATRNAWFSYLLASQLQLTATAQNGVQLRAQGMARRYRDDGYRQFSVVGGTPTGGTWNLTIGSTNITGLAYNITAATLQSTLISNGFPGAVVVGGPFPGSALHVFLQQAPGAITVTDSFTPGGDVEVSRTPTATEATLIPIVGAQITHRSASTHAGLGSAPDLTRVFQWQLQIDNRAGPVRPMDASGTFAGHVELAPNARLTVQVGGDSNGMAYLATLTSNDRLFWRMTATGGTLGSSTYLLRVDACLLLTDVRIIRDADGIVQASFTGALAHDPTWGRSFEALVRNGDATAL